MKRHALGAASRSPGRGKDRGYHRCGSFLVGVHGQQGRAHTARAACCGTTPPAAARARPQCRPLGVGRVALLRVDLEHGPAPMTGQLWGSWRSAWLGCTECAALAKGVEINPQTLRGRNSDGSETMLATGVELPLRRRSGSRSRRRRFGSRNRSANYHDLPPIVAEHCYDYSHATSPLAVA